MQVEVAVAKVGKYAAAESGDTFEMVERPRGGLALVLADGQSSGRGAKFISNLVARKATALMGEGVRDEAAAQAAHDYLFAYRGGKVSATLDIVSIDPEAGIVRLCRNSPVPAVAVVRGEARLHDEPSHPVGVQRATHPLVIELPIEVGLCVVVATDGLVRAGSRAGARFDLVREVGAAVADGAGGAQNLADTLLHRAYTLDEARPADDTSVLVVAILDGEPEDGARRLVSRVPYGDMRHEGARP